MDEQDMVGAQPAAAAPPEATAADVGSSQPQPPQAATAAAPATPAQESATVQPEGEAKAEPVAAGAAAEPAVVEPPAEKLNEAAEAIAEEKVEETPKPPRKEPQEKPKEKPEEKAEEKAEPKSDKMDWYILKVQSNREESIREGLLRRVAIAGLGFFFDQVIVPTEKVTEFKGGKKKVIKRKLYPGYLVVHMEINDDTWFLVRETPGIGDFTGAAGRPSPMLPHEVARIVAKQEEKSEKAPKLKIAFREGERVKIKEGTFENFEGDVDAIDETNGRVTVMINIFGRLTPVELEYWQIETL